MTADARPQWLGEKPVPFVTSVMEPFWTACGRRELVVPQCQNCGNRFFYPPLFCPSCHENAFDWIPCSGLGEVWSHTTVRMSFWGDAFAGELPYNVSWIALEEGVRFLSNVIGVPADAVHIGMPVRVGFEQRGQFRLPKFRPIELTW